MNTLIRVVAIFIIGLLLTSCKKNKASTTPATNARPVKNIMVSDELRSWGYYKQGSYWIMQDSLHTWGTDSIYVTSVQSTTTTSITKNDTTYNYETITITFNQGMVFGGWSLHTYPYEYISAGSYLMLVVDDNKIANSDYKQTVISTPVGVGTTTYSGVRYAAFSGIVTQESTPPALASYCFYWKKNLGALKYQCPLARGYNLTETIRYHIVQ